MGLARFLVPLLLAALISYADAKKFVIRNNAPTGWDLNRIVQGPTALVAVGGDGVIIRSTNDARNWTQVPSGLSFLPPISASRVIPPVEFVNLRYDALAGQWVALAVWDGDLETTTYAIAYSSTSSASSFQVAATGGADISQIQEPPVFGNGRWVAFSFTATGTASVFTTYDLSAGWTSQPLMFDCACQAMSSPAWSPSLNAFIVLLDKEIATSSDGANWKALTQITHTPLPYALNDAYSTIPPRPVFNDPVWLYFANSSGQPVQALINLANPRQPKSIALPLDVHYDEIQFVRHAGLYWLRGIHSFSEQMLQYSNDAYTWQNVSALPPNTNDALFVTNGYYYVAVADQGGIYTNSYNWQPVNSHGLQGNYAWIEWLGGPKPGFYASGYGLWGSAAVAYSADGSHWAALAFPNDPYPSYQYLAYNSAQGIYVATDLRSNVIYVSTNMGSIQEVPLPVGIYSECLCVGNPPAIAIPATLLSTPVIAIVTGGGKSASVHSTLTGSPIQQCAYGSELYVAITNSSAVYYSYNATVWLPGPQLSVAVSTLRFLWNYFVAIGPQGTLLYSSDGRKWTTVQVTFEAINGVTYDGGQYIAVGEGGSVFTSTNLSIWTQIHVPAYTSLTDVAWDPTTNVTVIVGGGGLIMSN